VIEARAHTTYSPSIHPDPPTTNNTSSSMRNRSKKSSAQVAKQPAGVEVEVSLDSLDDLYSIFVTEGSKIQSVVSVPTATTKIRTRSGRRLFRGGGDITKKNSSEQLSALMQQLSSEPTTNQRLADSLRPLSPNMSDRHSAMEDTPRGRTRDAHSCPPPTQRRRSHRASPPRPEHYNPRRSSDSSSNNNNSQRMQSCPPPENRQHSNHNVESESGTTTTRNSRRSSKKPNLVSKTAARNRLFGSLGRKVVPTTAVP